MTAFLGSVSMLVAFLNFIAQLCTQLLEPLPTRAGSIHRSRRKLACLIDAITGSKSQ